MNERKFEYLKELSSNHFCLICSKEIALHSEQERDYCSTLASSALFQLVAYEYNPDAEPLSEAERHAAYKSGDKPMRRYRKRGSVCQDCEELVLSYGCGCHPG